MSKRYKTILAIRFFGYFLFLSGLIAVIFILGPIISAEAKYRIDRIKGVKRTVAAIPDTTKSTGSQPQPSSNEPVSNGGGPVDSFGNIQVNDNQIVPVSTEFGIVIEKIDANAKVIANVNPAKEQEYVSALKQGVAEALGSTPPGQKGNLYLFSHSTDAPWNIVRFNAIFYLLRELDNGDRVIIFYQNKRYDYIVFDKTIAKPSDVSYLTNRYDVPVLTLQTCDPPGTLLNRLIIRARLVNS